MATDDMEDYFKQFKKCLEEAMEKIEDCYFKVPVAGGKKVFRERVYCYELYHQLRNAMKNDRGETRIKLMGEVDKSGHPIIEPVLGPIKPDFIIHAPGKMEENLIAIEVKPIKAINRNREMGKVLEKLRALLKVGKYHWVIMLVYGDGLKNKEGIINIREKMRKLLDECQGCVLLMWHPEPREKPKVILKHFHQDNR